MLSLLAGCVDPATVPPSDLMRRGAATHALGNWQTITRSDQGNARIIESEAWHIEQHPTDANLLRGGYRRVVTVTSHASDSI
ncbi:MAG TPA: hypothetical protein PLF40_23720, partial [Kofleriaceae bacterium]|nr:hypothetical protein [Kofleriaceae bacterium]